MGLFLAAKAGFQDDGKKKKMEWRRVFLLVSALTTVVALTACGEEGSDGGRDLIRPAINFTSPTNNAVNIPVDAPIQVAFSEEMKASSLNASTFTVSGGMAGTITYEKSVATFKPLGTFLGDTTYTFTITKGVKDAAGNSIRNPYTWSFTTGSAALSYLPRISSTMPESGAMGVAIDSTILITFTKLIDPATINGSTITVSGGVTGSITHSSTSTNTSVLFTPSKNLLKNTTYTVTVTDGVKDTAGKAMEGSYVWTFTTGSAPDTTPPKVVSVSPANNSAGAAVNAPVTVSFSEAMDESSLNGSTFTVSGGVTGTVKTSGATATFTPSTPFSPNSEYTATLTTGIKDITGNPMAQGYTWKFKIAWTNQGGTAVWDSGTAVAVDASGDIYVTGHTAGGLDGNTGAGSADIFLAKYGASGMKLWVRQSGTPSHDAAYGVATDTGGNVYVTGSAGGGLDGNASAGGTDIFLMKYDSAGVKLWTRQFGTPGDDSAKAVATDIDGNVYVAGSTEGGLDGNTSAGGTDFFLAKYDASGVRLWTRQLGTSSEDSAQAVATYAVTGAATGGTEVGIYVTGITGGGMDGNANAGATDMFLVKYNAAGEKRWARQLGAVSYDAAYGLATSAYTEDIKNPITGEITKVTHADAYVTGNTSRAMPGNSTSGGIDFFLAKYDSSGTREWVKQYGSSANDTGYGVAANTFIEDIKDPGTGNVIDKKAHVSVYVAGSARDGLGGNGNAGSSDLFLVKYDQTGERQWARQLGTAKDDVAYGAATDAGGNIYLTGYTEGGLDGGANAGSADLFLVKYNSSGEKQ